MHAPEALAACSALHSLCVRGWDAERELLDLDLHAVAAAAALTDLCLVGIALIPSGPHGRVAPELTALRTLTLDEVVRDADADADDGAPDCVRLSPADYAVLLSGCQQLRFLNVQRDNADGLAMLGCALPSVTSLRIGELRQTLAAGRLYGAHAKTL